MFECGCVFDPQLQHLQFGAKGFHLYFWKGQSIETDKYRDLFQKVQKEIWHELSLNEGHVLVLNVLPKQGKVEGARESAQRVKEMEALTDTQWMLAEKKTLDWKQELLDPGLEHLWYKGKLFDDEEKIIHMIKYDQKAAHLSLVVSKTSESHRPNEPLNHIGSLHPLVKVMHEQQDAIIGINGSYFDYTHTYYSGDTASFVGDPALPTIIREHSWNPPLSEPVLIAYLVQEQKGTPFRLMAKQEVDTLPQKPKYMLPCSPPLLHNSAYVPFSTVGASFLEPGTINPPGRLGHLFTPNSRSVVAIDKEDNLLFITIEGATAHKGSGMNFAELVATLRVIGVKEAANLDGGGSTAIWCRRAFNKVPELLTSQPKHEQKRDIGTALLIFNNTWPRAQRF